MDKMNKEQAQEMAAKIQQEIGGDYTVRLESFPAKYTENKETGEYRKEEYFYVNLWTGTGNLWNEVVVLSVHQPRHWEEWKLAARAFVSREQDQEQEKKMIEMAEEEVKSSTVLREVKTMEEIMVEHDEKGKTYTVSLEKGPECKAVTVFDCLTELQAISKALEENSGWIFCGSVHLGW